MFYLASQKEVVYGLWRTRRLNIRTFIRWRFGWWHTGIGCTLCHLAVYVVSMEQIEKLIFIQMNTKKPQPAKTAILFLTVFNNRIAVQNIDTAGVVMLEI